MQALKLKANQCGSTSSWGLKPSKWLAHKKKNCDVLVTYLVLSYFGECKQKKVVTIRWKVTDKMKEEPRRKKQITLEIQMWSWMIGHFVIPTHGGNLFYLVLWMGWFHQIETMKATVLAWWSCFPMIGPLNSNFVQAWRDWVIKLKHQA